jgi:hypothetical protein
MGIEMSPEVRDGKRSRLLRNVGIRDDVDNPAFTFLAAGQEHRAGQDA